MATMPQTSPQIISERLKEERNIKGLSQARLAEIAGVDRKTVNRIENGHYSPTLETLLALGTALGLPPHMLVS